MSHSWESITKKFRKHSKSVIEILLNKKNFRLLLFFFLSLFLGAVLCNFINLLFEYYHDSESTPCVEEELVQSSRIDSNNRWCQCVFLKLNVILGIFLLLQKFLITRILSTFQIVIVWHHIANSELLIIHESWSIGSQFLEQEIEFVMIHWMVSNPIFSIEN